jgi:hypothetical protein
LPPLSSFYLGVPCMFHISRSWLASVLHPSLSPVYLEVDQKQCHVYKAHLNS